MKKLSVLFATLLMAFTMNAQNPNASQTPQIAVSGTGKVAVAPDQVSITVGSEIKGDVAEQVKKENDAVMANIIKFLKSMKLADKDYQTQRINLNKNRDYETKTDYFLATQSITVHLKDISKYEEMMLGLIKAGANQVQGVEFKSSKVENFQTEARTKAVNDAKKKAQDYANALGQKVGKAIFISDESAVSYPRPIYMQVKMAAADAAGIDQTLAVGEIEVTAAVSISFSLE